MNTRSLAARVTTCVTEVQRRADRVSRVLANWAKLGMRVKATIDLATVNGQPGAVFRTSDGEVISVLSLDVVDGKVAEIRSIVNPDKLQHVGRPADMNALMRPQRAG